MKKMYLYTLALIFTGLTLTSCGSFLSIGGGVGGLLLRQLRSTMTVITWDTTVLMAEYLTMMHAVKPCSFQTRWPTSSD